MIGKSKNSSYSIKTSKPAHVIDTKSWFASKSFSRGKSRESSKRQSAINVTASSDTKGGNKLGTYNMKTIASRHTRHKSMLCNIINKTKKNQETIVSKTIDDKRHYPKPIVTTKSKAKIYWYSK